jgi:hypothetical protein
MQSTVWQDCRENAYEGLDHRGGITGSPFRGTSLQVKKTHAQQVPFHERKPDLPARPLAERPSNKGLSEQLQLRWNVQHFYAC